MVEPQSTWHSATTIADRAANRAPAVLTRTIAGQVLLWPPAMEERYGFGPFEAIGRTCWQLLQTMFWQPLDQIQAHLLKNRLWMGGLLQRHANGRLMPTAHQWYLSDDPVSQEVVVIELHSDIAAEHLADIVAAIAHELSQPLAAVGTYLHAANREPLPPSSNMSNVREAVSAAASQFDRIKAGMHLFRELGDALRGDR